VQEGYINVNFIVSSCEILSCVLHLDCVVGFFLGPTFFMPFLDY
jgi:hypothetical protein